MRGRNPEKHHRDRDKKGVESQRHNLTKQWEHGPEKIGERTFWTKFWLKEIWNGEQRNCLLLFDSSCVKGNRIVYILCK